MKDVRSIVMQLSGRWGNKCYNTLCLAIEAALEIPRDEVQMKVIWREVGARNGRQPEANSRALARAALDIWNRGNRALLMEIFGRTLEKAPSSKELLLVLTDYIRPELEYRCWQTKRSQEYGLLAKEDAELRLVTEPFSKDRAFVKMLARRLNVQQKPIESFRAQFLSGQIPGVLPQEAGRLMSEEEEGA